MIKVKDVKVQWVKTNEGDVCEAVAYDEIDKELFKVNIRIDPVVAVDFIFYHGVQGFEDIEKTAKELVKSIAENIS